MPNELAAKRWKQAHSQSPGELLKMLRGRAGITQAELATLLGFSSPRMIKHWEGDFYLPTAERLQRVIEVYLCRQVFVEGQELAEAELLWDTVKSWFETRTERIETFSAFDRNWFGATLKKANLYSANAITLATNPIILTLPTKATQTRKNNLPLSLTSFVGRSRDIQQLSQLLSNSPLPQSNRLVTISGTGGSGKTRLALETTNQLNYTESELYKDGIWLVELAGLSDGRLLAQTIASVLSVAIVKEQDSTQIEKTLLEALGNKDLLLVLDNCEHLIDDCAKLATKILSHCPNTRILATSREVFNLNFETNYRIGGLAVPKTATSLNLAGLIEQSESARLFVERAKNKLNNFESLLQETDETGQANLQAIVVICQQLDGLPLALELAAALVTAFTPVEIASQLAESDLFELLAKGERSADSRHQTLEATIDWSYKLLSKEEQLIFRRLAIFVGGWTLEAAQEICAVNLKNTDSLNHPLAKISKGKITAGLPELISKSLVIAEPIKIETKIGTTITTTRYRYLETIRQFILGKLWDKDEENQANEWAVLQAGQASYYIKQAQQAESFWRTKEEKVWQKRLDLELDNLRAVLSWCQNWNNGDKAVLKQGLELCGALGSFWQIRGYFAEGRLQIEAMLEQGRARGLENSQAFLKAQNSLITISLEMGDYKTVRYNADEVIERAKLGGFLNEQAEALRKLGSTAKQQGDYQAANNYLEESLKIFTTLGNKAKIAQLTFNLGSSAIEAGDLAKSKIKLLESLPFFEEAEDLYGLGRAYNSLAIVFCEEGDYKTGSSYFEQSLGTYRKLEYQHGITGTLLNLGKLAIYREDYCKAKQTITECSDVLTELKDNYGLLVCFIHLAEIALIEENWAEARYWTEKELELARQTEEKISIAEALEFLGWLEINVGNYEQAKTALSEATTLRVEMGVPRNNEFLVICLGQYALHNNNLEGAVESIGFVMTILVDNRVLLPYKQKGVAEIEEKARAALGEAVYGQLLEKGKGWSVEQLASDVLR